MTEQSPGFSPNPLEKQQKTMELLSQPTRHRVLQLILGHPDHLVSKTELDHYIPRSVPTIQTAVNKLKQGGIVDEFRTVNPDNPNNRDYPTEFIGLTPQGVHTLDEYNFLGAVPVLRAVFDAIEKDETEKRHLNADRPELPDEVHQMLYFDESGIDQDQETTSEDRTQPTKNNRDTWYKTPEEQTQNDTSGDNEEDPISDLF
jgi:hypothetical protein